MRSGFVLTPSGIEVDWVGRRVHRAEGTVDLGEREAELLAFLADRPGVAVGRDELLREIWRVRPSTRTKALDMCVRRLRERIELDPDDPQHVLTVRGTGYRFVPGPTELDRTLPRPDTLGTERPGAFLGRDRELAELGAALSSRARVVTVLGTSGVGKSRLAREAARRVSGRVVWLVDLGEVRTEAELARAVGRVAGVSAGDLGVERLAAALSARGPTLLVLDAAEGCVEPLVRLVTALLGLPALQIIVTSRRTVHGIGGVEVRLDPLPEDTVLALLLDRAGRPLDDAVRSLAGRLDGLPLAVELAAGRLRMYTCDQLLARLDDGWGVLRTGGTDRHASLESALLVSWEILEGAEREALGRLAVFRGGFTLDAARMVLDAPPGGSDADALIQGLLDHSLLRVGATGAGAPRFRLFDSVRELAEERCDADTRTRAEARHAAWFLATSYPAWPPRIPVDEEDRWIDDVDNIVAAIERSTAVRPGAAIAALTRLWQPVLRVDAPTLYRLVSSLVDAAADEDRALALLVLADATMFLGDDDGCEPLYAEALAAAERSSPALVPWIRVARASAQGRWTAFPALRGEWETAVEEARALGDARCEAYLLRKSVEFGFCADEESALGRAMAIYREVGDEYGAFMTEVSLGLSRAILGIPAADAMLAASARWQARSRQPLTLTMMRGIASALYLEHRVAETRAWTVALRLACEAQAALHVVPYALEMQVIADLELGHLDSARAAIARILSHRAPPEVRATAHLGLGLAHHAERDLAQACGHYRLVVATNPHYEALGTGLWMLADGGDEARAQLADVEARGGLPADLARAMATLGPDGAEAVLRLTEDAKPTTEGMVGILRLALTAARLLCA